MCVYDHAITQSKHLIIYSLCPIHRLYISMVLQWQYSKSKQFLQTCANAQRESGVVTGGKGAPSQVQAGLCFFLYCTHHSVPRD